MMGREADPLLALLARYGNPEAIILDNADPASKVGGLFKQYEKSRGSYIVDATSEPCGLYLGRDKSLVLSDEIAINGTFDVDANWMKGPGWSISGGKANCDGTQSGITNLQQVGSGVGEETAYIFELTISDYVTGVLFVFLSNSFVIVSANGTYRFYIYQRGGADSILLRGNASWQASVDGVSVKKILGNHPYQDTDAPRPLLAGDGGAAPWHHTGNGSSHFHKTGFNPGASATIAAVFRGSDASDDIIAAYDASQTNPIALGLNASGYVEGRAGSTTLAGSADVRGVDTVALLAYDASEVILEINNLAPLTGAFGGSITSNPLYFLAGNDNGSAVRFWNGRDYKKFIMADKANEADRALLRSTLANGIVTL